MAHTAAASDNRSLLLSESSRHPGSTGASAPPRKPKRPSEQSDPADLVQVEYEEPAEDITPTPDEAEFDEPEFDEPSESPDADEFPDPTP